MTITSVIVFSIFFSPLMMAGEAQPPLTAPHWSVCWNIGKMADTRQKQKKNNVFMTNASFRIVLRVVL